MPPTCSSLYVSVVPVLWIFLSFLIFGMRFFFLYVQSDKHTLAIIQRQIAMNKVING